MSRFDRRIARWLLQRTPVVRHILPRRGAERTRVDHIIILDGTNSTLVPGDETNAGILYKLLRETAPIATLNLHYEDGVPWDSWRSTVAVITGRGINGRIKRAYGAIASRYQPGDRIYLFGFSRGAYAVRSLAGIIGMVGLLKPAQATERNIRQVFRLYEQTDAGEAAEAFAAENCIRDVPVEMVGVWDTVKSLGFRAPIFWRWAEGKYKFHDHELGDHVRNGYHALALHETRVAYSPVLWETPADYAGNIEQVWFRGAHGDVGGQLGGYNAARPLSNIPLVWLLKKAERCGVRLPDGWEKRFEVDALAPHVGTWRSYSILFWSRRRRDVGRDKSEAMHPSTVAASEARRIPIPKLPLALP